MSKRTRVGDFWFSSILKEMNCENAQGFYFSRPVDPAAIGQMIWDMLHIKPGPDESASSSSGSFELLVSTYSM